MSGQDLSGLLVLTRRQAAALFGLSVSGFDVWVRKGLVPGAIPGTRRWSRAGLERAIDEGRSGPVAVNDNLSPFEIWKRQNANTA